MTETLVSPSLIPSLNAAWHAPQADLNAALSEPVWAALDELGVIAASGVEAASFLHNQLTNDVNALSVDRVQLNGYCTPKGRLLAVFDHWRTEDQVLLQLPAQILPSVLKRLSMFVLRAKAKLVEASEQWDTIALLGPGAAELIKKEFGDLVSEQGGLINHVLVSRLPAGTHLVGEKPINRYVLRAPVTAGAELRRRFNVRHVDSAVYFWSQIDAAIPTVLAATQETFVPQMINLEVLGGVNFRKGCYPGQEIVARSQYLGKLRRRMSLAHVAGAAIAGDDVFGGERNEAIGKVVMAAEAPGGGMDLLFECAVDQLSAGSLRVARADGPLITRRELPYQLVDVTA